MIGFDAILIISPDHGRLFAQEGWTREQLITQLIERSHTPGEQLVRGASGIAEGIPPHLRDATLPKFRPGGILLTFAGGGAGLFSSIVAGWANSAIGSDPVTRVVGS